MPGYTDDTEPQVDDARKQHVAQICKRVSDSKEHWKKAFARMRSDMKFAEGNHWRNQIEDDDRLQADVIQRHLDSRTAALYARNPTVIGKPKKQREFAMWDGRIQTALALFQRLAEGTATPADGALLMDIQRGMQRRKLKKGLADTAALLVTHSMDEQEPTFKSQLKQLIPRVLTCGVGYIRTDYQREFEKRPETQATLEDVTPQLATFSRLQDEIIEGDTDVDSGDADRARTLVTQLQEQQVISREGAVYTFPKATAIIPDDKCVHLVGFIGSDLIAEEHPMTGDDIMESFGKKVGGKAKAYTYARDGTSLKPAATERDDCYYCVWEVFHKKDGLVYWVVDGYSDFLKEPAPPSVRVKGFWPIRALLFNRAETERNPFPRSDVRRLRALQMEINRTLEALRQHRIAKRPLYISKTGIIDKDEKKLLSEYDAHDVIELNIPQDMKASDAIEELKKANIDPNMYILDPYYDAFMRVSGSQEANLGGTSGATATETSVAEAGRISSLSSNTDDLDDLLTAVADDTARIHEAETSYDEVLRVVGPGAVWPDIPTPNALEGLYMTIRAGSSGRPNRDRQAAVLERLGPILVQVPGIEPETLAEYAVEVLDEGRDLSDWYNPQLPSITATNSNKQPAPGDAERDPQQQGGEGGDNAKRGPGARGGPQPSYQQPGGAPQL